MSKRYFINNLDTYLGQAIYRQLYKPEEENEDLVIIGTKTNPLDREKLPGVKKILNREKPKLFRKYLIESDVCIYDLHFGDIKEVEFAVNAFKAKQPFEEQKTLILISSVLVWDGTPKKIKPVEEVKKEEDTSQIMNTQESEKKPEEEEKKKDEEEEEEEEEEGDEENGEEKPADTQESKEDAIPEKAPEEEEEAPPEYIPFKEEDYKMREPKEKYRQLKELEDLVLSLNIENVKVYVLCAGIFYGAGELAFKNVLKSAWLQNPAELPYIGNGENLVPTIHIDDLAKFVLKVADNPPENNPYIFAIDNTKDRRQRNIIESISRQVGTGKVASIEEADNKIIPKEHEDAFTCDVWMVPTPLLVPATEEETVEFEWTAEKGIPESMDKILSEFCKRENLRPIKIMVKGHSHSEKSKYAKEIAQHYNIPVIRIKQLFDEGLDIDDKQLGKDFKKEKEKIREYLAGKKEANLDEALKVLYRLVRWRLRQNDCRNRGFVLDDFPNHLQELEYIFYKKLEKKLKRKLKKKKRRPAKQEALNTEGDAENKPPEGQENPGDVSQDKPQDNSIVENKEQSFVENKPEDAQGEQPAEGEGDESSDGEYEEDNGQPAEEGAEGEEKPPEEEQPEEEEEEEEGEGPRLEPYFPDAIIYFKRGGKNAGRRGVDDSFDENSTEEERERKFQEYEKATRLYDYFRKKNIDVYIYDPSNKHDEFESFSSLRVFIEKDGRPNNYLKTEHELAEEHIQYYVKKHETNIQSQEADKSRQQQILDEERIRRENIAKDEMTYLIHNEIPDPEEKNKPFRNYLMEYITPILGEGLLNISDILPDDPVDYLVYRVDKIN